ncbi:hypothetical protein KGQ20_01360 [Catenulispora sp. NF23]|uniref:hypothetical protein n=1 Tax=Catenulispora pinistramenti TaxID=2705254 RepID=UPI001BA82A0E|nr:hypothetical protein [Catenulispora pinistramenti]MBS2531409.1 hypothetical protein [Catenulispora pinistramenti]
MKARIRILTALAAGATAVLGLAAPAVAAPGYNDATGGMDCGGDYQCNAVAGYDGPTGLGMGERVGGVLRFESVP